MLLPWDTPALSSLLQLSRGSWRARQYVGSGCWLEKKRNMSASSESYQEKKRRSESGWMEILNKFFTAKGFPLSPFLVISWLTTFGPLPPRIECVFVLGVSSHLPSAVPWTSISVCSLSAWTFCSTLENWGAHQEVKFMLTGVKAKP